MSSNLCDNTIAVCTVNDSWWWTGELSETCRILFQSKFENLVHLIGFIIRTGNKTLIFSSFFRSHWVTWLRVGFNCRSPRVHDNTETDKKFGATRHFLDHLFRKNGTYWWENGLILEFIHSNLSPVWFLTEVCYIRCLNYMVLAWKENRCCFL